MPFEKVSISDLLDKALEDSTFKDEFHQIKSEYALIEQITSIRRGMKITQAELAKRANVSQQAISRLEKEKHLPKIDTLMRIVDGLGLKLTLAKR